LFVGCTVPKGFIWGQVSVTYMPRPPHDVVCNNPNCALDMFEIHHSHEMPDDVGSDDYTCPYCGSNDLEEIWPE